MIDAIVNTPSQTTVRIQQTAQITLPILTLAGLLSFLGLSPTTAVLTSAMWFAVSALGGSVIQSLVGQVELGLRPLLALGPGALLGFGVIVIAFLGVRGGWLGFSVVLALLGCGSMVWLRRGQSNLVTGHDRYVILSLLLISGTLLANSKEFPNLLVPSLGVMLAFVAWSAPRGTAWRLGSLIVAVGTLIYDVVSRPLYWWWSSDDTTTLSGIGTIIVERGRVADVAGWSTSSHHWFLHAWLALWNQLSFGHVFETYLIAWPVVAAISMFASLLLCIELFLGRRASPTVLLIGCVVTAGLVRLEWPAPQEQQPFVFAMVATALLWLRAPTTANTGSIWRRIFGSGLILVMVPLVLFVLKPSLLVAYGLIIVGAVMVRVGATSGKRLLLALVASVGAITAGIGLMSLGSSWVAQRSFTTFSIKWFPDDLGWCSSASTRGSLACVISLQVVLFACALLAAAALWLARTKAPLAGSPVVLMPLALAYLPLRYFVSSGVGSGAPSFYRLSEMVLMIFVVLAVAATLHIVEIRFRNVVIMLFVAVVIAGLSQGPSIVYDAVDRLLTGFSPLRYLNASDVIALCVATIAALVLARWQVFGNSRSRYVFACFVLISMLPIGRMVFTSATTENDPTRLSRPADFGPEDIEQVGQWLRDNTTFGTLVATNYLCPSQRLKECTREKAEIACAQHEPSLMSSWALMALSKREFLYLSQGWDSNTLYYFIHRTSTRLGSELSTSAVSELEGLGVSYYVASRQHSHPRVWPKIRAAAAFSTENFAVVSLATLTNEITT